MKKKNSGRHLRQYVSISAIFIALSSTYAYAESTIDYFDLSPEQLTSATVISASKREEDLSKAPAAVFVITGEDIARSGVTNIPDALRMAPGVQVARADSNSWAVSIRGFNDVLANKLLVMVDGRTIYSPLFGGVMWEAQDLMLEDIDRIEVVRGPGGTLWGANAVNGIINIITKKASDTQGNLVSGIYGTEEQGTLSMRHGGAIGDNGFYRIYAKDFNRDETRLPGGDDNYDKWDGYRSGFRADLNDNHFTLQGDVYRVNTQQQRIDYALTAPFATLQNQTLIFEGANILGRWVDPRDDGSQLSIQTYLDWTRREEPFNFTDQRTIFDIETQYNFPVYGRHEIISGVGFRFSADDESPKGNRNVSFSTENHRDSLYNCFVQDKIMLLPDKLYFTIGSKLEHNEYSGGEIQPSARLQWSPDTKQTVWAAVSRAVRTPTIIEEDTTSTLAAASGVRLALVGNENAKSEELIAYELGYRNQITPDISADVTAFFNDYDHLTTLGSLPASVINNGIDPVHLLIPTEFENNMTGKAWGFEFSGDWSVSPDFKLTSTYSFMHLLLDAEDNSIFFQEGDEDNYPTHQVGLRAAWNISDNWTLDTSAQYVSQLKGGTANAYTRLDMNLGWKINDNVRFNLIGQNLGDSVHNEFGDAQVERSVFGKFTWEF